MASLSGWPAKLDVELADTVAELGRWPAVTLDLWPAGPSAAPIGWRGASSGEGQGWLAEMMAEPGGWPAGGVSTLGGCPAELNIGLADAVADLERCSAGVGTGPTR